MWIGIGGSLVNVHNTHWQPTFHILTFSWIWVDPELKKLWAVMKPLSMSSLSEVHFIPCSYGSHSTEYHCRSPSHCFKCYKNREREMTTNCSRVVEIIHLYLNTGIHFDPLISPQVRIEAQSSRALTHRIWQNKRTILLLSHKKKHCWSTCKALAEGEEPQHGM